MHVDIKRFTDAQKKRPTGTRGGGGANNGGGSGGGGGPGGGGGGDTSTTSLTLPPPEQPASEDVQSVTKLRRAGISPSAVDKQIIKGSMAKVVAGASGGTVVLPRILRSS